MTPLPNSNDDDDVLSGLEKVDKGTSGKENNDSATNDERRPAIRRIPNFQGPRVSFPDIWNSCPNNSVSVASQTTLIATFSYNTELSKNLLSLCSERWKTDPIVAIVILHSDEEVSSAELHVSTNLNQALTSCPHVDVLLYGGYLVSEGYEISTINIRKGESFEYTPINVQTKERTSHDGRDNNQQVDQNTETQQHQAGEQRSISVASETSGSVQEVTDESPRIGRIQSTNFIDDRSSSSPPPLSYVHNVALQTVHTSHVLILEGDVQPMVDLDASLRTAYTSVPSKAALLIPTVTTEKNDLTVLDLSTCVQSLECSFRELELRDFENLIVGPLVCIKSTHFEPHLVVPWCVPISATEEAEKPYSHQQGYPSDRLAWHDENLTKWTWRRGQADYLRHAGLAFWLAPGFVLPTAEASRGQEKNEQSSDLDDDNIWNSAHQRVLDRFGDSFVQVHQCPS